MMVEVLKKGQNIMDFDMHLPQFLTKKDSKGCTRGLCQILPDLQVHGASTFYCKFFSYMRIVKMVLYRLCQGD